MRRALLMTGLLTLCGVWLTALPQLAQRAFWAHMTMHMGVVAVAAPLLALGIAGGRFDPVRRAPGLFAPIPASIVELIVVWAWHAPAFHQTARHSSAGFIAEQAMFFASGMLVWLSAFGGAGRSESRSATGSGSRSAAGVIGLLLTSMHMTLLGSLLALTPRPLYHPLGHYSGDGTGLTPIEDQHLGGAIMLVVGALAYLAGGLWLTAGLMRSASRTPEERI